MSLHRNFVNGEWVAAIEEIDNVNPSDTDDIIGRYAQGDSEQTKEAITCAYESYKTWSRSGIQQRFEILDAIGSEILARKHELGELLSREEGKVLSESIGEVTRAGQVFKFFAGEALRIVGDLQLSTRPGVHVEVIRESVGPVGIITPWNFPIAIPAWKIAPALAFGNTVVFKPASLVPGSAWALTDIISRSGLPPGAFNLIMGSGSTVGNTILKDDRIRAVSFTGSVVTGSRVASACSARGAKYQLEMGGKNPLIILNDADMENALNCAISGAFFSTGQRCTASSRLVVQSGIYDRFTAELIKATKKLRVGDPLRDTTQIGPVVDQSQLDQNLEYIRIGVDEGATLATGGERLKLDRRGFFMTPAIFTDTKNSMRINREEIFGPIATVINAETEDEAVTIANDTPFGLSAAICTRSLRSAERFKRDSQAGIVMINLPTAGVDHHVPFGGSKGSSYGPREQGRYAAEFYTTVKTMYVLP